MQKGHTLVNIKIMPDNKIIKVAYIKVVKMFWINEG